MISIYKGFWFVSNYKFVFQLFYYIFGFYLRRFKVKFSLISLNGGVGAILCIIQFTINL